MIVLAWLFVLTRIVHAAIHVGPNKVRWRSPAFALGFLIVAIMWIKLFLHVATARRRRLSRCGLAHTSRPPSRCSRRSWAGTGRRPRRSADWGKSHRFAGSGDRAAIGNLVYDALRRKRSLAAQMGSDSPRAIALAAAPRALGLSAAEVIAGADGSPHAVEPLSEAEQAGLSRDAAARYAGRRARRFPRLAGALVRAAPSARAAAEEGAALALPAPGRSAGQHAQGRPGEGAEGAGAILPVPTPLSPLGVRLPAPEGAGRHPNVEAETAHGKGWYEVQDEGSQIAALMAGAGPRQQVLDICAGAGGKTLAFAAAMRNTGQIYAYDDDALRLRPIFERLKRAGARNVQVLQAGDASALAALGPRFDVVFVDAPCTGTRRLAPAARRQVAAEAGQSCPAPGRAARDSGAGGAAREARRPARLRHLLGAAGGERRPDRRVPGEPFGLRGVALARGVDSGRRQRAATVSADGSEAGAAPHAGPPRHRRLLHRGAAAGTPRVWRAHAATVAELARRRRSSTDKCLTWKLAVLRIAFC